jgi:syntaxin 5
MVAHALRIDANVEEADINVNEAQRQLVKYMATLGSQRWLMLRVFGVLLILFVAFVLFAA